LDELIAKHKAEDVKQKSSSPTLIQPDSDFSYNPAVTQSWGHETSDKSDEKMTPINEDTDLNVFNAYKGIEDTDLSDVGMIKDGFDDGSTMGSEDFLS
jgi:hypothetical protein